MKKFNLPLTTAISAAISAAAIMASAGCSSEKEWQINNDTKLCVDQSGNRVAEDRCANQPAGSGYFPYRWYYISRGGYVPYYNYPVGGGSYAPSSAASSYIPAPVAAPAGAVTRGGFGSMGEGHGGEGGAEGVGE
jgi:hypothetical protein